MSVNDEDAFTSETEERERCGPLRRVCGLCSVDWREWLLL